MAANVNVWPPILMNEETPISSSSRQKYLAVVPSDTVIQYMKNLVRASYSCETIPPFAAKRIKWTTEHNVSFGTRECYTDRLRVSCCTTVFSAVYFIVWLYRPPSRVLARLHVFPLFQHVISPHYFTFENKEHRAVRCVDITWLKVRRWIAP